MQKLYSALLAAIFGATATFGMLAYSAQHPGKSTILNGNANVALAQILKGSSVTVTVLNVNGTSASVRGSNGRVFTVNSSAIGPLPMGETITLYGYFQGGVFVAQRISRGYRHVTAMTMTILSVSGVFEMARADNGRIVRVDTSALGFRVPIGETVTFRGYFNGVPEGTGTFIATSVVRGYRRSSAVTVTILGVNGVFETGRGSDGHVFRIDTTALGMRLPIGETITLRGYWNGAGTFIATSVLRGLRPTTAMTGTVVGESGRFASFRANNGRMVRVDMTSLSGRLPVGRTITIRGYFDAAGTFIATALVGV